MHRADVDLLEVARSEAQEARLSEAEADARRALIETLQQLGKYNAGTPKLSRASHGFSYSRAVIRNPRSLRARRSTYSAHSALVTTRR